ncbi:MAG TPA: homoserine O-succinyltransferase [Vitreimonas sp.]|uniref:homoserine O-succinyltransferase MetX n=1 Tax=Vitreimonas sp. TaxID=3069702 RepID=UPI002D5BA190|nr:homoserine O-succinyltransferase [Vitreimonas sp.]HYD86883.1 homoserine O-succinyltransferase [Vitreimonas sp.]
MSALARRSVTPLVEEDIRVPIPAGFRLRSGDGLAERQIEMRLQGASGAPLVAVLGGISAGRHVAGEAGWWREIAAPAGAIDLNAYAVLGLDFAPLTDQRVRISPADQADLVAIALDALGVSRLHAFVGASYGGMVGLAFAAAHPARLERLCVLSAGERPAALGCAWRGVQRRIVEYALARGEGDQGLALARQLAMTTYRSAEEFEQRFGGGIDANGRSAVDAYLEARGEAYPQTMAPRRWLSLSEAIDRHSIDPASVRTPTVLVASASDQIVPVAAMRALATRLPALEAFHVIPSIYGHDAFLKETAIIGPLISEALKVKSDVQA